MPEEKLKSIDGMIEENKRTAAIEKTREWVEKQGWYRAKKEQQYTPTAESLIEYEKKYGIPYRAGSARIKEPDIAKPVIEDPDW